MDLCARKKERKGGRQGGGNEGGRQRHSLLDGTAGAERRRERNLDGALGFLAGVHRERD